MPRGIPNPKPAAAALVPTPDPAEKPASEVAHELVEKAVEAIEPVVEAVVEKVVEAERVVDHATHGLVAVTKDGETLHVRPGASLDNHLRLGWKQV
jgi:hypothetical protein